MKKIIFAICLMASCFSLADEQSKSDELDRLLEATNSAAMLDSIYDQYPQMMSQMSKELGIDEKEQEKMHRLAERMSQIMREEMNWEKMKGPMKQVYMKHFTEKEISDMLAFYESDSGRAMTKKMPAMMQDIVPISIEMTKNMIARFEELKTEFQ